MKVSNYEDKEFVKEYDKKPIGQPYILYPGIIKALGNLSGKKLLDLGCGSGELSRQLANCGAQVTGIDTSAEWIKTAKEKAGENKNLEFIQMNGAEMSQFENESFDAVVMNMVLINVGEHETFENIFMETSRVLKKDGTLVFSEIHPACFVEKQEATERQNHTEDFSYFENGQEFESVVTLTDGSTIKFNDIHWTLEAYTRILEKAGLFIHRLIEPMPIESAPKILKNMKVPEYLLLKIKKHS